MGSVRCGSLSLTLKSGSGASSRMWLSLPCWPLCRQKLKRLLKRPHISCATCLERRYHYNKVDRSEYVKVQVNQRFMMVQPYSSMILPKNSRWYCLIVNMNASGLKLQLKRLFTKLFLSLAELFANW